MEHTSTGNWAFFTLLEALCFFFFPGFGSLLFSRSSAILSRDFPVGNDNFRKGEEIDWAHIYLFLGNIFNRSSKADIIEIYIAQTCHLNHFLEALILHALHAYDLVNSKKPTPLTSFNNFASFMQISSNQEKTGSCRQLLTG